MPAALETAADRQSSREERVAGEGVLEQPACPLCGESSAGEPAYRFPPYAVVRCRNCSFWYLRPRLGEGSMREAYARDSYFEGAGLGYRSYLAQEATLRLSFRRFLGELAARGIAGAPGGPGGRLLEIGCAYGFFLEESRHAFAWRVGTDYAPAAVEIARTRADRVYLGGIEALAESQPFDCAACIHVIEHIYEPRQFIADLLGRLRPGGWVVLATPNMGSLWRRLMGPRWPFFKVPEHVTYFDRRTLRRLLRDCGCEEVQMVPYASVFSLEMIGEKLGWQAPAFARRLRLWLPGTTIAAAGRKPAG
ncbi:MAG TPA: class I SAM-dependent methyltransferase [Thermoanaerobaculia bacterium]|nr:class I SAM-dependent methyltransferase [Thermoanaerobaculia bacterium]